MSRILALGLMLASALISFFIAIVLVSKYLPAIIAAYHMVRSISQIECHGVTCVESLGGKPNVTILDAFIARSARGDAIVLYACSNSPRLFRVYVDGKYAGATMLPYNPLWDPGLCEKNAVIVVKRGSTYIVALEPVPHDEPVKLNEVIDVLSGAQPLGSFTPPVELELVAGSYKVRIRVTRVLTLAKR